MSNQPLFFLYADFPDWEKFPRPPENPNPFGNYEDDFGEEYD
ncbi:hypothetical protein YTPLAS73_13020 [Nitrosarchaeum sp.]|nr:hypothetical protein YTPLAS73_13020 [Nitrosarchaeum sp.]